MKYGVRCQAHGVGVYPTLRERDAQAITHLFCVPHVELFRVLEAEDEESEV
ncbi:hypothetical protein PBI_MICHELLEMYBELL_55 [Mycobacterium phage MichelleMyBell]|uniref:Uncharacterized protein n=1 Tax=Mycobacterium phage MichelleMyBell TaxID=1445726 RepID=W0LP61_9CAUD|nr:hypothetical protein CH20_gp55 [Mycobacterium phage MichelleMyBell]AHG24376.1 hypothetical protein PBI_MICHELLEMYBELL_55 [Mycobacterium phage MichelleMyBell]